MAENLFESLKCVICLDFAELALETTCCHQVGCSKCMKPLKTCPTCKKKENFAVQPSAVVRRMISNIPVVCTNKACGMNTTKGELEAHLKSCPAKLTQCPAEECEFSSVRKEMPKHIAETHPEATLECICQTFYPKRDTKCFFPLCEEEIEPSRFWAHIEENHQKDLEILKESNKTETLKWKNRAGRIVNVGINGKFYCQMPDVEGLGRFQEKETCAYPFNNCTDCMELDVLFRGIKCAAPMQLVNKDGRVCKTDACLHRVGSNVIASAGNREVMVDLICQKKTCGNNPIFYCDRERLTTRRIRKNYPCTRCNCAHLTVNEMEESRQYCRRQGERKEICDACGEINNLMNDNYNLYSSVWD